MAALAAFYALPWCFRVLETAISGHPTGAVLMRPVVGLIASFSFVRTGVSVAPGKRRQVAFALASIVALLVTYCAWSLLTHRMDVENIPIFWAVLTSYAAGAALAVNHSRPAWSTRGERRFNAEQSAW